jgi:glycosyltransferase involved in cell wall biosynthesis
MKILHILSTPRAEGTPNLVLDWLATGAHEQEVFVLNSQPADLTERLKSAAQWYGEADYFSHGRRKFTDIAKGVYRVCRDRQPDLVLCWPTGFANWACLGARLAGIKCLLVHAGNPPRRSRRGDWMSRYGMWPLTAVGAKIICCSDYVRAQFASIPLIPKTLFHTVWNCSRAVDVSERAAIARNQRVAEMRTPTAVMVATLERHKDHATLFLALAILRSALPGFQLRLAGDGSLRSELEAMATELEVGEMVEFLGTRRDVPELLGQADLFVLSTTPQEGLGSVLLEAMAAEIPIVASDVPACREVLANGQYGTLVRPADPAQLADAIIHALHTARSDVNLPEAREFAVSFTAQRMMDHYLFIAGLNPES